MQWQIWNDEYENLCHLDKVAGKRFFYVGLPLRIRAGSGSPIPCSCIDREITEKKANILREVAFAHEYCRPIAINFRGLGTGTVWRLLVCLFALIFGRLQICSVLHGDLAGPVL